MTRYSNDEISHIIQQLREGNFHPAHPAWEDFFALVRPLTIALAVRADLRFSLNLSNDDLDDLSQIVAQKLFSILGQFNPQYPFSAWLTEIVKNHAINMFRRNQHTCPLDEELHAAHGSDSSERDANLSERLQELRSQLDPQQQDVLDSLMRHYDKKGKVRLISQDLSLSEARIYQIIDAICTVGHILAQQD